MSQCTHNMFQFHGNINFVTSNWIYQDDRHLDDLYYGLSLLHYNSSLSSGGCFFIVQYSLLINLLILVEQRLQEALC